MPQVAADPAATIRAAFGKNADRVMAHYGLTPGGAPVSDLGMRISSDLVFHCPLVALSLAQARAGNPVWQYYFDYAAADGPPIQHFSELRYVFGAPGERGLAADAAPLQRYWVNFAKSGDPNGAGLPQWPRFDAAGKGYLAFLRSGPAAQNDLRGEVCRSMVNG